MLCALSWKLFYKTSRFLLNKSGNKFNNILIFWLEIEINITNCDIFRKNFQFLGNFVLARKCPKQLNFFNISCFMVNSSSNIPINALVSKERTKRPRNFPTSGFFFFIKKCRMTMENFSVSFRQIQ